MTDDMVISPRFPGAGHVGDAGVMVNVLYSPIFRIQAKPPRNETTNRDTLEQINNSTSLSSPIPDTSVYM
jgi:hypothetical protein